VAKNQQNLDSSEAGLSAIKKIYDAYKPEHAASSQQETLANNVQKDTGKKIISLKTAIHCSIALKDLAQNSFIICLEMILDEGRVEK